MHVYKTALLGHVDIRLVCLLTDRASHICYITNEAERTCADSKCVNKHRFEVMYNL